MARGDIHWFNRALLDSGLKLHNLATDVIKMGIVTNGNVPTANTPDLRWGAGGTGNAVLDQVPLATGYAGPITLAGVTFTQVANIPTLTANVANVPQDASGFTTGYYGIIYNDTANQRAIAFLDLGGPVGNANGPIDIDWNGAANSILTLTAA